MKYDIKSDFNFLLERGRDFFKKENFIKPFLFIFFIYFLGYLALFRANIYYIDDLGRSIDGYRGWENFSRFTSNFLSQILNFSARLTDISPIGQIIALLLISLTSLILVRLFCQKISYPALIASTCLGLSPYYAECMSYKFDAPYMAVAMLASITPFLFVDNRKVFFISSIFLLNLMFTTYQAGNSLFVVVSIMFVYKNVVIDNLHYTHILSNILLFVLSFVLATLIYKLLIVNEVNTYVSSHALPFSKLWNGVLENILKYLSLLLNSFKTTVLFKLIVMIVIVCFFNMTMCSENKVKQIISYTLFFSSAMLASFGLYLFLEKPLWDPRAFYGIGGYVAIVTILTVNWCNKFTKLLSLALSCALVFNLIIILSSYGNALKAQQDYSDFRIEMMLSDLNRMNSKSSISVHMNNKISLHPVAENSAKAYPVISKLVFQNLRQSWLWTSQKNYSHFMKLNFVQSCKQKDRKAVKIYDTALHKIEEYPKKCFEIYYK